VSTGRYLVATLVLFTALTAVMTYPQVLHLTDTVHDDGDPLLNAWALTWVAHQLPRAPAHLFDANIFYPERRTLAFSETLLVPAAIAAPLHWIGVGPLLVYNLVFLSGFIVSGAGIAVLVRSLTGNAAAGIVGGIVFAFLPYRIDHYPHLQLQQTQCLPLAFWAFHRLLRTGRLRDGVLFGAFTAGQVLSCMYYGLFLVPYMAVVCGALLVASRSLSRDRLAALVVAGAIALVAVVPVGRAYMGARQVVGERGVDEIAERGATWENYLGPPEANALYGSIFKRFAASERRLFPGFVAVAIAALAFWPRRQHLPTDQRSTGPSSSTQLAYLLGLLIAFDMSLGFNGISYGLLYQYVLPFRGLRIPARMGIMVGFSLAVLAGFGADRLASAIASPSRRRLALGVVAMLMLVEYASKPLDLRRIPTSPPESYADIVRDRGDSPTAALFEFPASAFDDPTYMYYSTFHWQHLVNGYSGFFPPSYQRVLHAMHEFPDEAAFDAIRSHGARYLVIHGERLFGARYEELIPMLDRRPDLTLVSRRPASGGGETQEISVYRISYASVQ
jgi:hypothetical protein